MVVRHVSNIHVGGIPGRLYVYSRDGTSSISVDDAREQAMEGIIGNQRFVSDGSEFFISCFRMEDVGLYRLCLMKYPSFSGSNSSFYYMDNQGTGSLGGTRNTRWGGVDSDAISVFETEEKVRDQTVSLAEYFSHIPLECGELVRVVH